MKITNLRLITVFVLLLLLSLNAIALDIDQQVLNSINETGTANVIVMLKDNSNMIFSGSKAQRIDQIKQRGKIFSSMQNKFLSDLNDNDFKVRHKFKMIGYFADEISLHFTNGQIFNNLSNDIETIKNANELIKDIEINDENEISEIASGKLKVRFVGNLNSIEKFIIIEKIKKELAVKNYIDKAYSNKISTIGEN